MARSSDGNKREKILDAAVVEIARHGFYQTTVAMIAKRAGVADGTIYLYFRNKWSLRWLGGGAFPLPRLKRRPRLRIHDPGRQDEGLSKEVDRILAKIHRQGEDSLSRKERRTLESASREYQKRRGE